MTHIDAYIGADRESALYADESTYRAAIELCAVEGISLEMTHIQIPESITLGIVDQRDADIAQVCRCIEAAGRAGLRGLNCASASTCGKQPGGNRGAQWLGTASIAGGCGGVQIG